MILIVGLGRSDGDITKNGLAAVKSADKLFVRTLKTAVSKQIKKYFPESMDDLYDKSEDFEALNRAVADRILNAEEQIGADKKIVYCVDGSGFFDGTASKIFKLRPDTTIVAGVCDSLPTEPVESLQIYPADGINTQIDTSVPLLIRSVDDRFLSGNVKLRLLQFYGGDEKVLFYSGGQTQEMTVLDIDRQKKYGADCYVFIPAVADFKKERYSFSDLIRIMERLTAPGGCPWDIEQTHASIAANALEEANELVEAINLNDTESICKESGDVILQGIFHGDIARRTGSFTIEDVIDALCKKLVSRHTHVFGADKAMTKEEALEFWKKAKVKEREQP